MSPHFAKFPRGSKITLVGNHWAQLLTIPYQHSLPTLHPHPVQVPLDAAHRGAFATPGWVKSPVGTDLPSERPGDAILKLCGLCLCPRAHHLHKDSTVSSLFVTGPGTGAQSTSHTPSPLLRLCPLSSWQPVIQARTTCRCWRHWKQSDMVPVPSQLAFW